MAVIEIIDDSSFGGWYSRPQQRQVQFTPCRLLALTLMKAHADLVKLCLAHDPGQAEQQANVASLTPTSPSEPLKPSTGAAVRDYRNAVRDRSESLSVG
jgi:hypothetical protein